MPYLPPLNLIRKKMNSWHLTSRLTARSFSESTASRVRSGRCPRQCTTLLHGQMYLQEKTPVLQFGHTLTQNSWIRPIMSYLWMIGLVMRFFSCGANLWRSSASIQSKKVQPLGFYFWPLRLGLFKSPFFGWWSWRYVVVPFCKDKCIFSKKHMFCNLGARWHKILEFVPSCPICGWLAWWCDFFPVGPTFEDHPQVFSQKRSSPLNFIFDTCALASWSHLFWLVKLNICGCTPFARTNVFSEKKRLFCNLGALTQNSWIRPIMSYLWMIGLEMRFFPVGSAFEDYPASIQSKKGPAPWILFLTPAPRPLQVTFLVGEAEHVCLYPFARTTVFSAKNMCFAIWARVDTKFLIRPIMSYLWMIGLVMRLFSCGANLWRSSASIQSKKVQPLGFYFWPLRRGLLKSLFLVGEGEHMCLYPFAKSCKESYPLK